MFAAHAADPLAVPVAGKREGVLWPRRPSWYGRLWHALSAVVVLCLLGLAMPEARGAPLQLVADEAYVEVAPHLQFHEDASGTLQIGELAARGDWTASPRTSGAVNLGYSRSVWWARLDVVSQKGAARYLEIAYPTLDSVELFVPRGDGQYRRLATGDRLPFADRLLPHHNLVFPIDLPAGPSTLYLRIASEGNLTLPVALWEPQAFHLHNQGSYAAFAIYYGMLLALGSYNLLLYFSLRDRTYLYYVLFLGSMAVGIATMDGLAGQFIWPTWPRWTHLALPVGMAMSGLLAACFVRSFLDTGHNAPRMDRIFKFFIAWFGGAILLNALSYQWAEMATSLGAMGFSTTALVIGVISYRRDYPGARYFLLAWTSILIGSIMLGARNFDWLPSNAFTTHGFQVGSGLEMLLLSYALADRISTLQRAKELADARLLKLQEEHVATLRRSEQVLERRVAQRTQALAEANARLEGMSRRDLLTGLGNRYELEEAWTRLEAQARRAGHSVALLLMDLDGFKPINDCYGHQAGDLVLIEVAARLRGILRATDTVIRLGGDEFVLLVSDLTADGIGQITKKIVETINAPMAIDGRMLAVGISVGAAVFPADGSTLCELLKQADVAMYREKRQRARVSRAVPVPSA
ncbi:MAG TPA: 7TM diverse intracellular signaling domain-containing protein [Azonexus sp.]|nr:7TM diverse intracellular signaling domain-containing protein [Azonexus sp.]